MNFALAARRRYVRDGRHPTVAKDPHDRAVRYDLDSAAVAKIDGARDGDVDGLTAVEVTKIELLWSLVPAGVSAVDEDGVLWDGRRGGPCTPLM